MACSFISHCKDDVRSLCGQCQCGIPAEIGLGSVHLVPRSAKLKAHGATRSHLPIPEFAPVIITVLPLMSKTIKIDVRSTNTSSNASKRL